MTDPNAGAPSRSRSLVVVLLSLTGAVATLGCSTEATDLGPLAGETPSSGLVEAPDAKSEALPPESGAASPPRPSFEVGCGVDPSRVERGDRVLDFAGGRIARLHVPPGYDPSRPAMLVFDLHPLLMDAEFQEGLSRLDSISDERGFVVVRPQGLEKSWNAGDCCDPSRANRVDDVGFVRQVLETVHREVCIDPKRVFATGLSNGAFLSHRLACELGDKFAAIAPVAGVLGIAPADCHPARAVSVLQVHGTLDPLVPWEGGKPKIQVDLGYDFRSVDASTTFWREHDGCPLESSTTYANGDTTCQTWRGCKDSTEVTLCKIEGGGHTWPKGAFDLGVVGLGKTSQDYDASAEIVSFFEAHPMP